MPVIKPTTERILNIKQQLIATGNVDVLVSGFEDVSVTATVVGSSTWQLLATNEEDAVGNPINFVQLVAASATLINQLTAGFRWLRAAFVLGVGTSGNVAVYGVRKSRGGS